MKGLPRSMARGAAQRQEIIKQTINMNAVAVSVTSVSTAVGFGTVAVGGFPEGNILFLGAVAYLSLAGPGGSANLVDTWNGDFAFGTAPTADVTLSGAEVDLIPSTSTTVAVAEVSPTTRASHAAAVAGTVYDNTDGSLEINLNVLVDAADISDDVTVAMTATGVLHLAYIVLGDD
jgi:hypothetical protein